MREPPADRPDFVALAESLAALAYPSRLEILDQIRFPHVLSEIRVTPHREAEGENPDRVISKQAVAGHLEKLVAAGLVRQDRAESGTTYVAHAARLYALAEDVRSLCVRYSAQIPAGDETGTLAGASPRPRARGPRLLLVHGAYEGKAYPLEVPARGPWLLGRSRDAVVSLDYDPFVSAEHAEVFRDDRGFALRDLRDAKNGTSLNWERLPRGGTVRLAPGDVIGVGRSLLSFLPH